MNNIKVKLVAIAKDEAAYLPEWIFHHLYFGFDEIEVYVNFTTDGSYEVLEKIQKNFPVKYKNAEYLIDSSYAKEFDAILSAQYIEQNPFQARAYAEFFFNAKNNGFTHIMFLDVDEYWTPSCFSKSIKHIITELNHPDIVSFTWKNKVGEIESFARPFESEVLYIESTVPKTMVNTAAEIKLMNSHICKYTGKGKRNIIKAENMNNAFILHRYQRSEIEYLSLLGRGDPKFVGKFGLKFNRGGYISAENSKSISFNVDVINQYDAAYQEFLHKNALHDDIEQAKKFVINRSDAVLNYIQENLKANKLVRKVIRGLTIENNIYSLSADSRGLNNIEVDTLKNIALDLEKTDLNKAYELMKIAHIFRPNGKIIERKFRLFSKLLGKDTDV